MSGRYKNIVRDVFSLLVLLWAHNSTAIANTTNGEGCRGLFRNDSAFYEYWAGSWIPSQSSIAEYLEDGRTKEIINRYWSGTSQTWKYASRKEYRYSRFSSPDAIILFAYNATYARWDTASRQIFSHIPSGKTDTARTQKFIGPGAWENLSRAVFAYDPSGNQTLYQYETWDTAAQTWLVQYRFIYTYEGALQTGFTRQKWDTASLNWVNEYRKTFVYDDQLRLVEDLFEDYDPEGDRWIPQTRITYSYDPNGHLKRELYESMYDSVWKNSAEYLYYAGGSTLDTLVLFRIWSGSSWLDNYRYLYSYDNCGNLTLESGQYADQGSWINDYRIVRYYSPVYIALSVDIVLVSDVSCYGETDGTAVAEASGGTPPYSYVWNDDAQTRDSIATNLSGNRWYTVTVTDAGGDTAQDSVYISSPPPVETGPIYGDTLVNPFEAHSYSVDPHFGSVYQWHVRGGKLVEETDGPEIVVFWLKPGVWTLTVTETDTSGCTGMPVTLTVYCGTTGIPENIPIPFSVYPNPADETLHIQTSDNQYFSFKLVGINGKVVRFAKNRVFESTLNVSTLPAGVYILQIRRNQTLFYKKVIIR